MQDQSSKALLGDPYAIPRRISDHRLPATSICHALLRTPRMQRSRPSQVIIPLLNNKLFPLVCRQTSAGHPEVGPRLISKSNTHHSPNAPDETPCPPRLDHPASGRCDFGRSVQSPRPSAREESCYHGACLSSHIKINTSCYRIDLVGGELGRTFRRSNSGDMSRGATGCRDALADALGRGGVEDVAGVTTGTLVVVRCYSRMRREVVAGL